VVTTYARAADGSVTYVGDARLATLPAHEKRLLSFGVDQEVTIDRREDQSAAINLATIADGVLTLTRTERRVTEYTIAASASEPRVVIVEQPRVAGFALTEPKDAVTGVSEHDYRIRVEVPAGATVPLRVVLERPVSQKVSITDLGADVLGAYAASTEIPAPVREALVKVAALRRTVAEKTAAENDLTAELTRVQADQARVREDLKVVPTGGALAQRYLTTLAQQEDRIAALDKQIADAHARVREAQQVLARFIASLRR
jgi:uncharacterized protein YhaN